MKKRFVIFAIVIVVLAVIASILILKDNQSTKTSTTTQTNTHQIILKGTSLSPKSFQSSDFTKFFEKSKKISEIISWGRDWNELLLNNSAPFTLVNLAVKYGYLP